MDSTHDQPKPSRRVRDRDPAQPTDLAERMVAFQRRNAAYVLILSLSALVFIQFIVQLVPESALPHRHPIPPLLLPAAPL
jgi:hypothetical protein